ncbi:MAG: hypothetical protein R2832_15250 [Rhodothermales bacterium]
MRLLLPILLCWTAPLATPTVAQVPDSSSALFQEGVADALNKYRNSDLAYLSSAHITTRLGQKFLELLGSEYGVAVRVTREYAVAFATNATTMMDSSAYRDGFNSVMIPRIEKRFGQNALSELSDLAQRAVDDELANEYAEQWAVQEDSIGIEVIGLHANYAIGDSVGVLPAHPIYIEVSVEDAVCIDERSEAGYADGLDVYWSPSNASALLGARAMAIAAALRYRAIPNSENVWCYVIVPIRLVRE